MSNNIDHYLKLNQKWSKYSHVWRLKQREKMRKILQDISGDDLTSMLGEILNKNEKILINNTCYQFILNLTSAYNSRKMKNNVIVKAFRDSGMKRNDCLKMGFKISERFWAKCGKEIIPKKRGTKKLIPDEIKAAIKSHLEKISSPSPDKTIKPDTNQKERINVRYLNCTFFEAYQTFQHSKKLVFQSFLNYLPKEYKKPFRLTDLCNYCEYNRSIIVKLKKFCMENNYEKIEDLKDTSILNINQIKIFFEEIPDIPIRTKNEIDNIIKEHKIIDFHRKLSKVQRDAYYRMQKDKDLLENSILLDFDFKQKIIIGISPRQTNDEYYIQQQRNVFGVGIFHLDNQKNIKVLNVDIVYNGSQDAITVVRLFRFLRDQSFFKDIDNGKDNYILWSDTGKHFRCSELAHYFLKELAEEKKHVNWNLFVEKHGKNSRDTHFSAVSNYVKQQSFKKQLSSTKDIVDAINEGQRRINDFNLSHNYPITDVIALELKDDYETGKKRPINHRIMTIPYVERYYNYRTIGENYKIVTSYCSNNDNLIEIDGIENSCGKSTFERFERKKDDVVLKSSVSINSIVTKQEMLTHLLKYMSKKETLKTQFTFLKNFFNDYIGNLEAPELCKETCQNCQKRPNFEISKLPELKLAEINEELSKHGHRVSRRNRNKAEAILELKNHLEYFHTSI